MRILKTTIVICSFLLMTIKVSAEISPTTTTKYSFEQIVEMYKKHKVANSNDVTPPQTLSDNFKRDFAKARDIDWEKSGVLYEVEFEIGWIGKNDYKAYYDFEGNLVMYRKEISSDQLPAVVKNAALTKYPNFKFDDVDKIVIGTEMLYKVSLEKGKTDVKMTLTHQGKIIDEYFD